MGNAECKECVEITFGDYDADEHMLKELNSDKGQYALKYKWVNNELVKIDAQHKDGLEGTKKDNFKEKKATVNGVEVPEYEIICDGAEIDQKKAENTNFTLSISAIKPSADQSAIPKPDTKINDLSLDDINNDDFIKDVSEPFLKDLDSPKFNSNKEGQDEEESKEVKNKEPALPKDPKKSPRLSVSSGSRETTPIIEKKSPKKKTEEKQKPKSKVPEIKTSDLADNLKLSSISNELASPKMSSVAKNLVPQKGSSEGGKKSVY